MAPRQEQRASICQATTAVLSMMSRDQTCATLMWARRRAWHLHDEESCSQESASPHRFSGSRQNNEERTSGGWSKINYRESRNDAPKSSSSTPETHRHPLYHSSPATSCYLLESFLKYSLFIADACAMSNIVSPTPRKRSARDRIVGSEILFVSTLKSSGSTRENEQVENETHVNPLERRIPAMTVDTKMASAA